MFSFLFIFLFCKFVLAVLSYAKHIQVIESTFLDYAIPICFLILAAMAIYWATSLYKDMFYTSNDNDHFVTYDISKLSTDQIKRLKLKLHKVIKKMVIENKEDEEKNGKKKKKDKERNTERDKKKQIAKYRNIISQKLHKLIEV
jgi:hypothetical protein